MKMKENKRTATLDSLAISVARGFGRVEERFDKTDGRFDKIEKDVGEVKENLKATRRDILDVGDRFVPRFEFDGLLFRVSKLEQKIANKR